MKIGFDTVKVNNKNLRVKLIEQDHSENMPWLVFLHEGLGCIELWKNFPDKLAEATGLNALVFDRQGYGGSDHLDLPRPNDYLETEALVFLPDLLEKLNIVKPILIGHSDGGSIALIYAGKHLCLGIICEAAHIYVEKITLEGIQSAKSNPDLRQIKEKLKKYHGDKTDDIFSAWADTWLSEGFKDWNISSKLNGIVCPVLLIQGLDDEYATPEQVEKIAEAMPMAAYVQTTLLENCAHVPHFQAADIVLNRMIDFIKQIK